MAPQTKKKSNIFKKVGSLVKKVFTVPVSKKLNLGANASGSLQKQGPTPSLGKNSVIKNVGSTLVGQVKNVKNSNVPAPISSNKFIGPVKPASKAVSSGVQYGPFQPAYEGPSIDTKTGKSTYVNSNGTTSQKIVDPTAAFVDTFGQQNQPSYQSSPAIAGTDMSGKTPSLPNTNVVGGTDYNAILNGGLAGIYNYDQQTQEDTQDQITKLFKDLTKEQPNQEQIYQDALEQSGKAEAQRLFNEKQGQLNAITTKAQADQLSLVGQGRGIPEAIIGGQQAQIAREAAIRALPISAELAAAQGNLEMATENLNTLYKIKSEDAANKYAYKVKIADYAIQFATKSQANKIQFLKEAYKQQQDVEQENIAQLNKIALELASKGKSSAFLNKIDPKDSNAVFTAIQMAGTSLMDVKSSGGGSSSNAYTVQPGDTGRDIALKVGLTWEALNQLNPGVNWDNLRPGQKLNTDTGDLKQTTTPEIGALSPANLTAGINYMINNNATPEEIEAFKTDREVQAYILNKIKKES